MSAMSSVSSARSRHSVLATFTAASAVGLVPLALQVQTVPAAATQASVSPTVDDKAVRPFTINVPEDELVDLRHRIEATRWPDKEPVADASQGVPLATMQK